MGRTVAKGVKAASNGKWIQNAVPASHKGLLHEKLGIPKGKTIPEATLKAAAGKKGKIGAEARFAENVRGLGK